MGETIKKIILEELDRLEKNPGAPGVMGEVRFIGRLVLAMMDEEYRRNEPTEEDFAELERRIRIQNHFEIKNAGC